MQDKISKFKSSPRPHILMLSIHGVHEWKITPGLTDTGGQNVFVNQFAQELANQGFKITIGNRGGYLHPVTNTPQAGVVYKDQYQRLVYLEDGTNQFVRKEDMDGQVAALAAALMRFLDHEKQKFDLVISHYWDAAVVANLVLKETGIHVPHIWIPHSLGEIKKRNVGRDQWLPLRIEARIENERNVLTMVDHVASTSSTISKSLVQDYGYQEPPLWLPPCISTDRFYPHEVARDAAVWKKLSEASGLSSDAIQNMKIITEISRTDATKRKDVLIKSFARIKKIHPNVFLVITIEKTEGQLGQGLTQLIEELEISPNIAVLGSVWEFLPDIYAISHIYCTPSILEGFGMSAQEAAATGVPVIASSLVPFAVDYLHNQGAVTSRNKTVSIGKGAIIVHPDEVEGFADAINLLLSDEERRRSMGQNAYNLTIPQFTWPRMVENFLDNLKIERK